MKRFISAIHLIVILALPLTALAGSLDSPGAPSAGSGMPTLQGICTQLDTGVFAPLSTGPFGEPGSGPGSTMCTLTQLRDKAPVADVAGAGPGDVLSGKKYWGLLSGSWGLKTGTLSSGSNVTGGNGLLTFPIPAGYYSGKTATASDSNLSSGNIKSGVSIFGVSGSAIESSGNATAGDVLTGMTFSNTGGSGISGTMLNKGSANFTPGATAVPVPAGYYSGGQVNGDANLASGNIISGVSIFGVSGSVTPPSGTATAGNVLTGYTFSNTGGTGISGTMPNNGTANFTPGKAAVPVAAGYYSVGQVNGDVNLVGNNIAWGVSIFGVAGTKSRPWGCRQRVIFDWMFLSDCADDCASDGGLWYDCRDKVCVPVYNFLQTDPLLFTGYCGR